MCSNRWNLRHIEIIKPKVSCKFLLSVSLHGFSVGISQILGVSRARVRRAVQAPKMILFTSFLQVFLHFDTNNRIAADNKFIISSDSVVPKCKNTWRKLVNKIILGACTALLTLALLTLALLTPSICGIYWLGPFHKQSKSGVYFAQARARIFGPVNFPLTEQ